MNRGLEGCSLYQYKISLKSYLKRQPCPYFVEDHEEWPEHFRGHAALRIKAKHLAWIEKAGQRLAMFVEAMRLHQFLLTVLIFEDTDDCNGTRTRVAISRAGVRYFL